MEVITIAIKHKLTGNVNDSCLVTVFRGTTVGGLLTKLDSNINFEETLIVYNGKTVLAEDVLKEHGQMVILPMLSGG